VILHPALTMAGVWLACLAAYLLLPFQLTQPVGSWTGTMGMLVFLLSFMLGALMLGASGGAEPGSRAPRMSIALRRTDVTLMLAAALAAAFFLFDIFSRDQLDLATAYQHRSDSAEALMHGEKSASTIWFQAAFLLYPAAYVFAAAHLIHARRISPVRLALFGVLPVALATLSMGGRMPILYLTLLALISYRERRKLHRAPGDPGSMRMRRFWKVAITLLLLALFAYFAKVFLVRADTVGGVDEMFQIARETWGVGFEGPVAQVLMGVLGPEATYLVFVFSWYLVQGMLFGDQLFAHYADAMQWGVYGVDLISAVMRRVDPERLSDGFAALHDIGVYGFFPSAWGSLFVDFGFPGALLCLGWGALAGLTYRRVVIQARADWFLAGPFVTMGIVMSTINTPLGLANGLVVHAWLLLALVLTRADSGHATSHAGEPEGPDGFASSPSHGE
jgi:oligosaccharide repeat unit polymerase